MNITKWSNAKLLMEIDFANSMQEASHPETIAWLKKLIKEAHSRGFMEYDEILHDIQPGGEPATKSDNLS